jgi:hypothetical protein
MMPAEGFYHLRKITPSAFYQGVVTAYNRNRLKSWIGYEQNAELIKQKTGIPIDICRDVTEIRHGDSMLIMKLSYRPEQRAKGYRVATDDFEYYEGFYIERAPIPAWQDLMSMDVFEPDGQRFIKDLYHLTGGKNWDEVERRRVVLANIEGTGEEWQKAHSEYLLALRVQLDPAGHWEHWARGDF